MLKELFSFFEEMDEMVYISDMESYEIVYMNRLLRESLGYRGSENYCKRKCHEVLQGMSRPCTFCTNASLSEGKFLSRVHKNSLLNKRFLIKDSQFSCDGHRYRIEIAVDIDGEIVANTPYFYARGENILNECLQQVFSSFGPEESLERILRYIGETFHCDRVYVFEFRNKIADNTYEWCGEGVSPQKEILQQVPLGELDYWMDLFCEKKTVTIRKLEEIRTQYSTVYAILKPQKVERLAAAPLISEDSVTGFIGVDNPDPRMMELIGSLLRMIGYFVVSLIKRRDLLHRLSAMSFRDALTGVYNRNALFDRYGTPWEGSSLAVIFCDVTGLKQANDTLGHAMGDQLICHCCDLIRSVLDTPLIFRAGGDEFVSVFENITESQLRDKARALRERIRQDSHHIAVGCAWSDRQPLRIEELIQHADKDMYQDKRRYYEMNRRMPGVERRASLRGQGRQDSLFYQFMNSTYCDMEQFFTAISQQNTTSYFYFGDMQRNMFYISDNMRDEFGFEGNVVPGLLQDWANRITTKKAREMYWAEMDAMLREKRSVHDLRYQVRTVSGKSIWIRCYGILKWNEDKSMPLFFSGRVTHQDEEFVIDPTTNFPREAALFRALDGVRKEGRPVLTIGFGLNHITEINNTRGRAYSDNLIRGICEELSERFADRMSFYRLEGVRCIAIVEPSCRQAKEELVAEIRAIIDERYRLIGLSLQQPCTFALMYYPQPEIMPADFLEQMVALIKTARHELRMDYVEYSKMSIEKSRQLANMALALSRDVLSGMEHFRAVVQPIVSCADGRMVGGETLLRWRFEGQDVPPSVFIPLLEKNGMIHLAGRWVFEQAVRGCQRLNAYDPDFYLTFNVSLQQISDEGFPEFMEQILAKYGLDGGRLVAEMTESCMDEDPERLTRFVGVCTRNGIRIALDDFGSGYSSFRMLLQYPTDIVKIDRSLLCEMSQSDEKMNFISSIVYACHRFGKQVCMEGVETAAQELLIREAGCDMIQGYYYYRAMELTELYRLLSAQQTE